MKITFNKAIQVFALKWFLIIILFPQVSFPQEVAQSKNHKFIIVGDTQHIGFLESLYWDYWNEHNERKTKILLDEISKREPDFILHLGDLTKNGSSKNAWKEFDQDHKLIYEKKIPYYPVLGNHEYFYSSKEIYNNFFKRFPHLKWQKWYSFVYEQIGFIMINSNFGDLTEKDTTKQRIWYQGILNEMEGNDSIKKIIVTSHHPPFTNSNIVGPNDVVLKDYANPFIRSNKGLFFFSGHCHSYERFSVNGKIFIVSGGGGGPRQKLNIDKKKRIYNDLYDGPSLRFMHFSEIESTEDSLHFRVIRLNDKGKFKVAETLDIAK